MIVFIKHPNHDDINANVRYDLLELPSGALVARALMDGDAIEIARELSLKNALIVPHGSTGEIHLEPLSVPLSTDPSDDGPVVIQF
ncbi:MAG: hypothetical protein DI596_05485 [Azospira oryzae]|nr:MAG: hypothetical protein DI596_05485 [Azospira oryzae]PZP80859.1 MAG: hypothetical protein DI593_05485 [Azospira oryzae]